MAPFLDPVNLAGERRNSRRGENPVDAAILGGVGYLEAVPGVRLAFALLCALPEIDESSLDQGFPGFAASACRIEISRQDHRFPTVE